MEQPNLNPDQRSIPEMFSDIAGHIQEIIRSEFALAKVEVKDKTAKAAPAVGRLGVGVGLGLFALGFFLLMIMFLLSLVLPMWLGALIVWVIVGSIALVLVGSGMAGLRRVRPAPERTVRTVKENVQWAKEQMQ